jgi:hypothetical protein
VYPVITAIPTLVDVLQLANSKLISFLAPYKLIETPVILLKLKEQIIDSCYTGHELAEWDTNVYAWFFVEPGEGGGTDAYFNKVDKSTIEIWDDYKTDGSKYNAIRESLSVGYYWSFRRSAGQPFIINLAYGLVASAIAELTDGYLFSDDGAWNGGPIKSKDFNAEYFVPSLAKTYVNASWYEKCLLRIIDEYKGQSFEPQYQLFRDFDLSFHQRLMYYPSGRLFIEGAAKNDSILIIWSFIKELPYLFINRFMIHTTENLLIQQMKLLDRIEYNRFNKCSIEKVVEIHKKINYEQLDFTFWVNPIFIDDGSSFVKQITAG